MRTRNPLARLTPPNNAAFAALTALVCGVAIAACSHDEPPAAAPASASPAPAAAAPSTAAASEAPAAPAAAPAPSTPAIPAKPVPVLALRDSGFQTPESVFYDADNDVYLVSNINGGPSAADNNGFISRVTPDGKVELKWIEAGKNGVKLDAPKGMTATGGVLYVADLTRVRMFDQKTGAPKGEVALPGATFANDLTAAPDGRVFATDSGIKIDAKGVAPTKTDAVYVVQGGKAKVLAKGAELGRPNGVAFADGKLWVVTFGGAELYSVDLSGATAGKKQPGLTVPKGSLDGLLVVGDKVYVSSWESQSIYESKAGGAFETVLTGLPAPADIGFDSKRNRILVPLFQDNAVVVYEAP